MSSRMLSADESQKLRESISDQKRKNRTVRNARKTHSFASIPKRLYRELSKLGRHKYRAIVVATWMSSFWDGWKKQPNIHVMFTRRMMAEHFNYSETTIERAIQDLLGIQLIRVSRNAVFSGRAGRNLGQCYQLSWMENAKGKERIHVYWGLLTSGVYRSLPIESQAVLILLHTIHHRKYNRLRINPSALQEFGIHRNTLSKHVDKLRQEGLLMHFDGNNYAFTWIDDDGKPNFDLIKKFMHLTDTTAVANRYQGELGNAIRIRT